MTSRTMAVVNKNCQTLASDREGIIAELLTPRRRRLLRIVVGSGVQTGGPCWTSACAVRGRIKEHGSGACTDGHGRVPSWMRVPDAGPLCIGSKTKISQERTKAPVGLPVYLYKAGCDRFFFFFIPKTALGPIPSSRLVFCFSCLSVFLLTGAEASEFSIKTRVFRDKSSTEGHPPSLARVLPRHHRSATMSNVTLLMPGHDGRLEIYKSRRALMRGILGIPAAAVYHAAPAAPASTVSRAAGPLPAFHGRGTKDSLFDGRSSCPDMEQEPSTLHHARARALMLGDGHFPPVTELPLPSTLLIQGSTAPHGMPWRGPLLDGRTQCMTVVVADIEAVGPVPKFMGRRQPLASWLNHSDDD
ncbi:hypothetical protein EV126DRAFT_46291 [Verticillium dahliae]|nr:hypothetical protein EV126DRAFT_44663 [Verticillium dahliae]KAH6699622.1 hypothetical protein EV126DRAFT_46291 [Verticillium dahliae]